MRGGGSADGDGVPNHGGVAVAVPGEDRVGDDCVGRSLGGRDVDFLDAQANGEEALALRCHAGCQEDDKKRGSDKEAMHELIPAGRWRDADVRKLAVELVTKLTLARRGDMNG